MYLITRTSLAHRACPCVDLQAMYGDLGYGVNGHAVDTRNQLDRVFDEYDFVYHVGVR
jgi:hypothetical protein